MLVVTDCTVREMSEQQIYEIKILRRNKKKEVGKFKVYYIFFLILTYGL